LAVIVIDDRHLASDQNVITDFNPVRGGDVDPLANSNAVANNNSRREPLVVVACNRMQPKPVQGSEILAHIDRTEATQVCSCADMNLLYAKFAADHKISKVCNWPLHPACREYVQSVFLQRPPKSTWI